MVNFAWGLDVKRGGQVDFVDYALLEGCSVESAI